MGDSYNKIVYIAKWLPANGIWNIIKIILWYRANMKTRFITLVKCRNIISQLVVKTQDIWCNILIIYTHYIVTSTSWKLKRLYKWMWFKISVVNVFIKLILYSNMWIKRLCNFQVNKLYWAKMNFILQIWN